MLDTPRPREQSAPQVTQWAFDATAGEISARDGQGRVLMAIATDPLFGPRLAAAFGGTAALCAPAWLRPR